MSAFENAVTLHQVHALERNVEARIVGILEQHELTAVAAGFDLAKALELADAVVHVNDVVAGFQLGEIAEENGGANFAAGARDRWRDAQKNGSAETGTASTRKADSPSKSSAHHN